MKTALFLLGLIALSAVNSTSIKKPLGRSKKFATLMEIDQNPLGNSVMSLAQIHLASKGPIGDILTLIDELVEETNNDQVVADGQHNAYRTLCSENIPAFGGKQQHHEEQRDLSQQTVTDTQGLLEMDTNTLESTIAGIEELTGMIASGTELRGQQAAAYVIEQARAEEALAALDEALSLVGQLYASTSGVSFIQVTSKIEDVTERLRGMDHLKKFSIYGPIVDSLMQVASQAQAPGAVSQILELLQSLRDQIQASKDEGTVQENTRIANWAKQLEDMTNQKQTAIEHKGQLESNISNYHTIIEENEAAVITHDDEQARYQLLLDTQVFECEQEQISYDNETAARDKDLEILGRLSTYMQDNVATMEDYMLERVDN